MHFYLEIDFVHFYLEIDFVHFYLEIDLFVIPPDVGGTPPPGDVWFSAKVFI